MSPNITRSVVAPPLVSARGLVREYAFGDTAVRALDGVDLDLAGGRFVSIVGPSGAGKSTLLRAVAGLESPKAGTIDIGSRRVFDGARNFEMPAEERNLGLVFQSYALWPHKTVADNVAYGLKLRKTPSAEIAKLDPKESGERGAVVMTSSIAGYEGQMGQAAYGAAKAGVIGLTISSARDLSSVGIRVNSIAPGTMATPIMKGVDEAMLARFTANIPFPKRLGEPDEFAALAQHLLENTYLNGEVIRIDGAQRFTYR